MASYRDPYMVFGTGRSGTSTVARLMHTRLGVYMGKRFVPANPTNPEGFYEDIEFYRANLDFVQGDITYQAWRAMVWVTVVQRRQLERPWGFKESRMGHLLGLYLGFFDAPRLIWCRRDANLVIASLQRCYGWKENKARRFYEMRFKTIDRLLKCRDHLAIDFEGRQLTDDEIIETLRQKWPELKLQDKQRTLPQRLQKLKVASANP